jgi:pimeloyl-[acyl-carrier protein] synthase
MCVLLLFAGHETTTHHIANGLRALLRFPAGAGEAARGPGARAGGGRGAAALRRADRRAGAHRAGAAELHGKQLKTGERVFLLMNAANRDPRAYPDPDRVDLARHGVPHLTFGFGAHICLGFPLARLEGQVALPAVLARWKRSSSPSDALEWIDSMVLRGMKAMPLRARA